MDKQELPSDEKEKLNAVLDAALDELDDDDDDNNEEQSDLETATKSPPQEQRQEEAAKPKPAFGPEKPPEFDMGSFDDVMKQMFQTGSDGSGDPESVLDSFMQQLQSQLASEMEKMESPKSESHSTTKSDSGKAKETNASSSSSSSTENNVDDTISKLLNDMATANMVDDEERTGNIPSAGGEEAMFQVMMKEFKKMGAGADGGFDQDALVDGMMQQLLSKEIMYDPMKQVTDRFPSWLEENKDSLSKEEYTNRSKQYKCFQQLIYVYENEPDNTKKLMELMQDVQEYGQPPPEIIKEIAPGLDLDEEGVPKLDGLGGLPFGDNDDCSIM